jgi:hypothetical protein
MIFSIYTPFARFVMKSTLIFCLAFTLTSFCSLGAIVNFDLAGLTNPTGPATNNGNTRQFSMTTGGGELTITYTLNINMGLEAGTETVDIDLANAYQFGNLFRRPGSGGLPELPATGGNMVAGESLSITLDSIAANSGWTLNSLTKSNTVGIAGDGRNGSEQATFSVNGGTAFTLGGIAASDISTLTDNRFTAFDSAGDSLLFQTTAGNTGKLNLRNLAFTADVTAIPEPSTISLLGLSLGALYLLRRRRT